jgi:hypothetical protein
MKKLVVLLSIVMIFMTGCSVYKLDDNNISKNIKIILSHKSKLHNVNYDGYKYYLPKGISFVNKDEYNALLKDMNNNYYYMYVDVISYYHKAKNDYELSDDAHFSQRLDYNHKTGYVQIDETDDKYFVQFVYNYVKIETYVSKKDLTDAINNICYILRSVKFNDSVIESLIGENALDYQEEEYSLFKAKSNKESYMEVVKRSENDEYNKYLEDEKINLDY